MRGLLPVAALMLLGPGLAQAQQVTPDADAAGMTTQLRSPVLTIDVDRIFAESLFGQRLADDLRAETEALAAENRRIEAALTAEVESLTDRRPDMPAEVFRAEADAFDDRVQGIRRAQDAKERALQEALVRGREALLEVATPILGQIMTDRGAAVILDRRSVFLSLGVIDVTDAAIAAIDAELGDGRGTVDLVLPGGAD